MDDLFSGDSQTIRILVVDDETVIRDLFKIALERNGYTCCVAENGQRALEELAATSFDVVVTDIDMPVMDGIELSKIIKSKFMADVIVMTGRVLEYKYDGIIGLGVSDFVEKPFSPEEMLLRINRVLKERRLKQIAKKAHEDLKESYVDSIHRLVMAAEYKDEDTGSYCPDWEILPFHC